MVVCVGGKDVFLYDLVVVCGVGSPFLSTPLFVSSVLSILTTLTIVSACCLNAPDGGRMGAAGVWIVLRRLGHLMFFVWGTFGVE